MVHYNPFCIRYFPAPPRSVNLRPHRATNPLPETRTNQSREAAMLKGALISMLGTLALASVNATALAPAAMAAECTNCDCQCGKCHSISKGVYCCPCVTAEPKRKASRGPSSSHFSPHRDGRGSEDEGLTQRTSTLRPALPGSAATSVDDAWLCRTGSRVAAIFR
jgi:hypothetical protein